MTTITRVVARDIRFPTSLDLSGSDVMTAWTLEADLRPSVENF